MPSKLRSCSEPETPGKATAAISPEPQKPTTPINQAMAMVPVSSYPDLSGDALAARVRLVQDPAAARLDPSAAEVASDVWPHYQPARRAEAAPGWVRFSVFAGWARSVAEHPCLGPTRE